MIFEEVKLKSDPNEFTNPLEIEVWEGKGEGGRRE
jgi:hypothetical protein